MTLLEKLRSQRQTIVEIDGHRITIERPTPMAAMDWLKTVEGDPLSVNDLNSFFDSRFSLRNQKWRAIAQEAIENFVVDWDLEEINIITGGTPVKVIFNKELFLAWVADHPNIVTMLAYEIFSAWLKFLSDQGDDEKKLSNGLELET